MAFLEVKIILSCVFLVYTNAKVCRTKQDPLPLAHIEASNKAAVDYQADKVIKDWDVNNVHSRLEGNMKYSSGCLTVPEDGAYYVYAQVYFRIVAGRSRVYIRKNQQRNFTMVQHPHNLSNGPQYTGGVLRLKAGDAISLHTVDTVTMYMSSAHTYFGAFLIA